MKNRKLILSAILIFGILININLILPQFNNYDPYSQYGQNPSYYNSYGNYQYPNQYSNQFNSGSNPQYQQFNSQSYFNSQLNSPSRNVQYADPRYQTFYNNGNNNYNQYGQYSYTPSYGSYGSSGLFGYSQYSNLGSNQLCQQGQNFLLMIAPGGCTPAVVRSDLLEEQNVPVFCRLSSFQSNPLLSGTTIRSITFSGEMPKGISGISYFPSRSSLAYQNTFNRGVIGFSNSNNGYYSSNSYGNNYYNYNQYNSGYNNYGLNNNPGFNLFNSNPYYGGNFANSPVNDNMGYLVVVLNRAQNESSLPDFVEGNITANINYNSAGVFGKGRTSFYLDQMNEVQWQRDYRKNSFWNAQAYVRANSIDQNTAVISIYRDQNIVQQTLTLREGETSPVVSLGGNYCSAGMLIRLDKLSSPVESALVQINGEQEWVAKGDRIINDRCIVQNIIINGEGGKLSISCPGSNFDLDLRGGKATLDINGNPNEFSINQKVKENIYLGYLGKDNNGNDLAVLVRDSNSNTPESFADKNIFSAVQNIQAKTDENIINIIIAQYKSKGYSITSNEIYVIKSGNPKEGISLLNLFTIQDKQDFNKNPLAKIYYDKAINYYKDLFDLYPNEKIAEEEVPYASQGLSESLKLSKDFQMNKQAEEFSRKISESYPNNYLSDSAIIESNYLFKYDRTNSKKIVQVDNSQYGIDLLEFRKPDRIDASGIFIIEGQEITLGIGEFYTSEKAKLQLLNLDNDRAVIGYEYSYKNGNRIVNRETFFIFGDKNQGNINGLNIKLAKVNLRKQAKVTILPNLNSAGSTNQVNFQLRIGIEKRAIKLTPEQTKDAIKSLETAINEWNKINQKLSTVIKTMKTACFATSAILNVKNLFEGTTGASIARNRLMKSSGGWNDKCADLVNNKKYNTIQQCLLDKNSEIEKDINIFSNQIQNTNKQLKDIQNQVGIKHEGAFDLQGQTDSKKVEELFKERFKEFCNNKNDQIKLPGTGNKPVEYSEVCNWEGMTHEQRREILTLTNIKDSEGSEVLKEYTDRELGRITLDAKNTNEARIAQITSEENSKKLGIDLKTINPVGDQVVYGQIKTITSSDKNIYGNFGQGDNVVRVLVPRTNKVGQIVKENLNVGGKEFLVNVEEIKGSGGVFKPGEKIISIDGRSLSDDDKKTILDYLSDSGLNKIKQSDTKAFKNQMLDTTNLKVKYFDRAPFKGLPSTVPFDIKEGWYIQTSYVLSGFGIPYDQSGRAANFYICNVGPNGLIEFKKSSDDICRYYNGFNKELNFPGMNPAESASLVQRAQTALQDATNQFGQENININGQRYGSGVSFDDTDGRCTDFMNPQDCNILFNVCDPVICPPSRCDLGGKYRVDNVIQTGVVGSLALCLPNAQEGIIAPICLTGVHAGIDGYISILNSTKSCLNESLETGQNIGICDEIKSVYLCDFFWRQASPFLNVLLEKTFEIAAGQGARGGGEYLTVQRAWANTEGAVNYFTGQYAGNSIQAFYNRNLGSVQPISSFGTGAYGGVGYNNGNTGYYNPSQSQGFSGTSNQYQSQTTSGTSFIGYGGNVGAEFCKSFISSGFSGATTSIFESLIEPDSPEQYTGWISENPLTTATYPPTSHYKVYYHIFAGKDIGSSYQIYLKGAPQLQGIFPNNFYLVDQGYIARGSEVDRARDFTATSGFQQLCININGREECGFGTVSTSYALNSITDNYLKQQSTETNIVSEKNCVAGSPSLYSLIQPNIQSGVEQTLNPQLYNKGIIRICSTQNPGKQVLPTGQYDTTASVYDKWKDVGYCDDQTIRCWLDTNSVKDVIRNTEIENEVLNNVNINALGGGNYLVPEQAESTLSEAVQLMSQIPNMISSSDSQQNIDLKMSSISNRLELISKIGPNNLYRARALYLLGNINKRIAEILFSYAPKIVIIENDNFQDEFPDIRSENNLEEIQNSDLGLNIIPFEKIKEEDLERNKKIIMDNSAQYSGDRAITIFYRADNKWYSDDINTEEILGIDESDSYKDGISILANFVANEENNGKMIIIIDNKIINPDTTSIANALLKN